MITRDDWMQALATAERQPPPDDPAVKSAAELQEIWSLGRTATKSRIEHLLAAGRLVPAVKWMRRSHGTLARIPAYKLVSEGPMARTTLDTEDAEILDGADTTDRAPDPADEEEDQRVSAHAAAAHRRRVVSQMRRMQSRRAKNRRVVGQR